MVFFHCCGESSDIFSLALKLSARLGVTLLDNPSESYSSGEMVTGRVVVETEKPMIVKEVTLLLEGTGRVYWSLTETFTVDQTTTVDGKPKSTPKQSSHLVAYSENEKYIFKQISLAGDNNNTITLNEGITSYPFEFRLAENLPSSFVTKYGYVAYFLEAELKRPVLKRNIKTTMSFAINGMFDLNAEAGARQPQQMQKTKGSNLLACRSGQLRFILRLPKSGFVPGEILDFSGEITNNSNRKINLVKASLQQVVQFQAKMITKEVRRDICTVTGPEIHTGDHTVWKPDSIEIPQLPPTRLGGMCKIIDVQYFLRFEANISGLSKSLFGELPVMIGTMPLRSSTTGSREQVDTPREKRKSKRHSVRNKGNVAGSSGNGKQFTDICEKTTEKSSE